MAENSLYLLFSFRPSSQTNGSNYKILYFYGQRGLVPSRVLEKSFGDLFLGDRRITEGFNSLEELELFASHVCTSTESKEVYIISNIDYNRSLVDVYNVRGIREIFLSQGKCLKNHDKDDGGGFFSRFF